MFMWGLALSSLHYVPLSERSYGRALTELAERFSVDLGWCKIWLDTIYPLSAWRTNGEVTEQRDTTAAQAVR